MATKISDDNRLIFRFAAFDQGLQYITAEARVMYRGLKNHGATCYLNSLLQCLRHIGQFSGAIYAMTREDDNTLLEQRRKQRREDHHQGHAAVSGAAVSGAGGSGDGGSGDGGSEVEKLLSSDSSDGTKSEIN